jgi:alpha-glucuronidase
MLTAWLGAGLLTAVPAAAEDGYDLWLRYRPVASPWAERYRSTVRQLIVPAGNEAAREELQRAISGMLATTPELAGEPSRDGAVILGTPASSPIIAALHLDLAPLGADGFAIRSMQVHGHRSTVIAANSSAGVLYASFHFLRLMQTRRSLENLAIQESPRLRHRILEHWDNLDGTVERGYAGASIWDWQKLPGYLQPRYGDYARACASIGINGVVLNNVNADAVILETRYLEKVAALAGVLRGYGIRVYLSARFTAPQEIGGLTTSDPSNDEVRRWWQRKVDEIYRLIPDFGGFLVKANSEGQPGPQNFGRSHADGANLFAAALAPHGGIVIWRAFVYGDHHGEDRLRQAFSEFAPLDGNFAENVLLQVKNGPLDFQPREPAHPLFGAMPNTSLMMEVQITKEYLGFATHLVYLGSLYEEALSFDTMSGGPDSSVAGILENSRQGLHTGMAGVANVGSARNWTGSQFDQANWYAFGRFAWNPRAAARDIAEEWLRQTYSNDARFIAPTLALMLASREAAVDYMTPLGLAHLMAAGHHYGPAPWQTGGARADWTPPYFHRADADGIGADRSVAGSNAVSQYAPPLAAQFNDLKSTPEKYLLWFHHVAWDYPLSSGRTLWDELVMHYSRGVATVSGMRKTWAALRGYVDPERFAETSAFLAIQEKEALWWRDACLAYFQSLAKRSFPAGYAAPEHGLQEYQAIATPYAPGNPGWTSAPFRH